jgi:hypothetical protein
VERNSNADDEIALVLSLRAAEELALDHLGGSPECESAPNRDPRRFRFSVRSNTQNVTVADHLAQV